MSLTVAAYRGDGAAWDRFVRSASGWTHFHLYGWRRVMEDVFGHECLYYACHTPDGTLAGVLPLVRVRSRLFGHFLVSMPFLNYGGPLGAPAAVDALVREAVTQANADGAHLLELRCRQQVDVSLPVSHRKVTVLLDLPHGNADVLWQQLAAKVRSQIRRPRKAGVTMRFGPGEVEPFYTVFARHMRDLGTPVLSKSVFTAIADLFPQEVWFGCAYLGGQPVAAGCAFEWNGEVEMTWASALRSHSRVAPNMLLYWSFMEHAVERGLRTFNFGRCSPGGGTHRFKRQWGGRDQPLWWYQHGSRRGRGTPSPEGGAYSWGPRVWRRLPLPLATWLGPKVVRSIP